MNYTNNIQNKKRREGADLAFANECLSENANEWYDEQAEEDYPEWEDYIAACDYTTKEITKEEYEDECPWDKED